MKRLNLALERSLASSLLSSGWWILLLCLSTGLAADKSVPKYQRFEATFDSSATYANPPQEAALTVTFSPPQGDKLKVPGFWDGGKSWKVRFSPMQTGRWKFETTCS